MSVNVILLLSLSLCLANVVYSLSCKPRAARGASSLLPSFMSSLPSSTSLLPSSPSFVPTSPAPQLNVKAASASVMVLASLLTTTLAPQPSHAYGDAEELSRKQKPTKVKLVVQETDLGIPFLVTKKGSGAYPNDGDFVVINYTALLSDGSVFDTTESRDKKPLAFRMGSKQVIPGLESVVRELQPGAEATCTIPAKYAYGDKGVCVEKDGKKECLVQPGEKIRYAIKMKTVGVGYN